MKRKTLVLSVTTLVALFASDAALAQKALYRCKDGTKVAARFTNGSDGNGKVTLAFAGAKSMELPHAPSADGGRYVSGDLEFWIKGRGATLTRAGKATTCMTK